MLGLPLVELFGTDYEVCGLLGGGASLGMGFEVSKTDIISC